MSLPLLLIVLFCVLGSGGVFGYLKHYYGPGGFGLFGVALVILVLVAAVGGQQYEWHDF
jgi:hypothetical protein